jgi:hypothetical protein
MQVKERLRVVNGSYIGPAVRREGDLVGQGEAGAGHHIGKRGC